MKEINGILANFFDHLCMRVCGGWFGCRHLVSEILHKNTDWNAVQHSPRRNESKVKENPGHYKFDLIGTAEYFELLRNATETKCPGVFTIGFSGSAGLNTIHGTTKIRSLRNGIGDTGKL